MTIMTLDIRDGITPAMKRKLKRTRDMSSAMRKIETTVIRPLRSRAWSGSGLESQSGELKDSVTTFHGKKSAGLSVRSKAGHDLIIPKAVTHLRGAKRYAFRKKSRARVKSHHRDGAKVRSYSRRNPGSPWGRIKKRGFLPTKFSTADIARITQTLKEYIDV